MRTINQNWTHKCVHFARTKCKALHKDAKMRPFCKDAKMRPNAKTHLLASRWIRTPLYLSTVAPVNQWPYLPQQLCKAWRVNTYIPLETCWHDWLSTGSRSSWSNLKYWLWARLKLNMSLIRTSGFFLLKAKRRPWYCSHKPAICRRHCLLWASWISIALSQLKAWNELSQKCP